MSKTSEIKNIRIIAEPNEFTDGYGVYLDCSGHSNFIFYYKQNWLLYDFLKNGINLEDLRRMKFRSQKRCYGKRRRNNRKRNYKLEDSVKHLLKIIDDFVEYELAA